MTTSMIERVARILEPQAWRALGLSDTLAYKNRRTSSLRKARAAIEAMREPTDAMLEAPLSASPSHGQRHESRIDLRPAIYTAMIDAALLEQQP